MGVFAVCDALHHVTIKSSWRGTYLIDYCRVASRHSDVFDPSADNSSLYGASVKAHARGGLSPWLALVAVAFFTGLFVCICVFFVSYCIVVVSL